MSDYFDDSMFLLLNADGQTLGSGTLVGPLRSGRIELKLSPISGQIPEGEPVIHMVGMGDTSLALRCRVIGRKGRTLFLKKTELLSPDYRENLRVKTDFCSFLYPLDDSLRGRCPIESKDLSCGGIAFYADEELQKGQIFEIVIPVTEEPIIVPGRLLRSQQDGQKTLYAAAFSDLCHDQEREIRGAVFRIQLQNMYQPAKQ